MTVSQLWKDLSGFILLLLHEGFLDKSNIQWHNAFRFMIWYESFFSIFSAQLFLPTTATLASRPLCMQAAFQSGPLLKWIVLISYLWPPMIQNGITFPLFFFSGSLQSYYTSSQFVCAANWLVSSPGLLFRGQSENALPISYWYILAFDKQHCFTAVTLTVGLHCSCIMLWELLGFSGQKSS